MVVLHSNMVRFIIKERETIDMYYFILHSNMVRFIIDGIPKSPTFYPAFTFQYG